MAKKVILSVGTKRGLFLLESGGARQRWRISGPLLKGWSVLFPEFQFRPQAEPLQILTVFLLTVVPYLMVTLVPAWKAAVIEPDEALRG